MDEVFHLPEWSAPLDLAAHLRLAPAESTVKGMFLQQIVEAALAASGTRLGRGEYSAVKDYPLHEWLELLVRGAGLTHPDVPVREGLRRLGQRCYPMLAESMIGKILVSVAGNDINAILRVAPRVYRVSSTIGAVEVSFLEPQRAIIQLREIWDFPDAYQVGIYEGGLRALGRSGEVRVRVLGPASADLELVWV